MPPSGISTADSIQSGRLIASPFFTHSPATSIMPFISAIQNEAIVDAIARAIVQDLHSQLQNLHVQDVVLGHKYHEDIVLEREIFHEDGYSEKYHFSMIWNCITNSELENLYDSLEDYSQDYVKDYVRDVYPDWRDCMG